MYCPICGDEMECRMLPDTGTSVDLQEARCHSCERAWEIGTALHDQCIESFEEIEYQGGGGYG